MYKLKSIRDNNKIRLFATLDGRDETECIFEAEVPPTNELRMDFQARIEEPPNVNMDRFFSAGFNAFGAAAALDVPAKYLYRGSTPVEFSVPCFLRLKDDPNKDLIKPFVNLMKVTLPERGEELTQYIDKGINYAEEKIEDLASLIGMSVSFDKNTDTSRYIGSIYVLKAPWPYGLFNGDSKTMTMRIGAIRYEGIVLTSVSLAIPTMLYEGGWPSHLALSLSFRSLRAATVDSVSDMFKSIS